MISLHGNLSFLGDDDADHAVYWKSWICGSSNLGGYLAIKDAIEVGDIQSFIQYVRRFYAANHTGGTGGQYVTVYSGSF